MNDGNIYGESNGIYNWGGNAEINGGIIKTKSSNVIYNKENSNVTINGGTFENEQKPPIYNYGTITINEGTIHAISGNTIVNHNSVTINGGYIYSDATENYPVIQNKGTLNIYDGKCEGGVVIGNEKRSYNEYIWRNYNRKFSKICTNLK